MCWINAHTVLWDCALPHSNKVVCHSEVEANEIVAVGQEVAMDDTKANKISDSSS